MATRGTLKQRRLREPEEESAPVVAPSTRRGRQSARSGSSYTAKAGGSQKPAAAAPKAPTAPKAPSAPKASKPAATKATKAAKPKSAAKSSMQSWAEGERKKLQADKKAQSRVRASVGEQAGKRTAKRMDSKGSKGAEARRAKVKSAVQSVVKKLAGSAVKPSKTGYAAYRDMVG